MMNLQYNRECRSESDKEEFHININLYKWKVFYVN